MEILNLLAEVPMLIFGDTYNVIELDWIGRLIRWLVTITGSVGLGIILFSIGLKFVTLPFDVFQRITMRKQNLKMKQNQERMEKLQKQYANDKEMYNQKVMEMYKENGMSMFSSCLPMILSLVIFFIAINAFNAYASYSNVENYNTMVDAYNAELVEYTVDVYDKDTDISYVVETDEKGNPTGTVTYIVTNDNNENQQFFYFKAHEKVDLKDIQKIEGEGTVTYKYTYLEDVKKDYLKKAEKDYFIDVDKVMSDETRASAIEAIKKEIKAADGTLTDEQVSAQAITQYFTKPAQLAVKDAYNETVAKSTKFLWIKNIWVTDVSYRNPVMEYSKFSTEIMERKACSCSAENKTEGLKAYTQEGYELVTAELDTAKNAPNGFFILVVLSIGTILLQQFVTMRSQKEQQKYSSVDGQAAGQGKMMMIMMTGMFAIFSFMYSSAFSVYLIVSNIFTLLSTIVINKAVDITMAKKEAAAEQAKYNRRFVATRNAQGKKVKKAKIVKEKKESTDKEDNE